ncbi:2-succinyl-6-hydroxy-2,4-cyclohexadiene-1-carboxylate synthase [Oceanobacillus rekensis]|uniref:2-succinyl-6-hydroxy-2, 4-cyclohexadiene-1-carboxylate synthase n=1 Tax=Oceanobacillus rekensis TaxID=937927 RepID=UPI001FEB8969|nr:2-succinyl-6-hydroxy-2,4-cyclohexadiene-1-carboxylate synthase [Oceanobacillus rekensis]
MYFSKDNKTYYYEVRGEGFPVVMLHGFTGSSATWQNFIDKWGSGYQIITIDLPGHGKTRTPSLRSMEECLQDLNKLFQSLGLETFHLLGYSMGGRTALSYTILYPEQVSTLILESASPGLEDVKERRLRQKNDEMLAIRIEQEGVPSFVDYWQDIPLFHSQKSLPLKVQKIIRSERLSQTKEGLSLSLRTMGTGSQLSLWSRLRTLDMPVLMIIGELDPKFVAINKKMQSKLKSGNLKICEDAGHAIHVEKPRNFGKMVIGFLNGTTKLD